MLSIEPDVQNKVKAAASILKKAPFLKVPQAMRAAKFSDAQSSNPALQMRVRRARAALAPIEHTLIGSSIELSSPIPTLSTLSSTPVNAAAASSSSATTTTTATSSATPAQESISVPPSLDKYRLTSTTKMKQRNNNKKSDVYFSAAMKKAMRLYYNESKKPEGEKRRSAHEIENVVKNNSMELGWLRGLSPDMSMCIAW